MLATVLAVSICSRLVGRLDRLIRREHQQAAGAGGCNGKPETIFVSIHDDYPSDGGAGVSPATAAQGSPPPRDGAKLHSSLG